MWEGENKIIKCHEGEGEKSKPLYSYFYRPQRAQDFFELKTSSTQTFSVLGTQLSSVQTNTWDFSTVSENFNVSSN